MKSSRCVALALALSLALAVLGLAAGCGGAPARQPAGQAGILPPASPESALVQPAASPAEYAGIAFNPENPADRLGLAEAAAEGQRQERTDLLLDYAAQLALQPRPGPDGRAIPQRVARVRQIRCEAARALGALRDRRASTYLVAQLTQDGDASVRLACLAALGQIQDFAVLPAVIEFLAHPDPDLAVAAMAAMNSIMQCPEVKEQGNFTFIAGTSLEARRGTAEKWRRWWKWWKGKHPELFGQPSRPEPTPAPPAAPATPPALEREAAP